MLVGLEKKLLKNLKAKLLFKIYKVVKTTLWEVVLCLQEKKAYLSEKDFI